jgi:hypothetical protein
LWLSGPLPDKFSVWLNEIPPHFFRVWRFLGFFVLFGDYQLHSITARSRSRTGKFTNAVASAENFHDPALPVFLYHFVMPGVLQWSLGSLQYPGHGFDNACNQVV